MANSNTPMGLVPRFNGDGTPWNGQTRRCYISAGATNDLVVGPGDIVILDTANANKVTSGKYPTVMRATSGTQFYGVVTAVVMETQASTVYRAIGTARYVDVVVDRDAIYEAQEDGDTTDMSATSPGLNVEVIVGTTPTGSGISGMQLDSSSAATTVGHDLKVISLVDRPDNAFGDYAKWLVQLNHSQLSDNKVGIGA
mgnify:CR=1 FL=1